MLEWRWTWPVWEGGVCVENSGKGCHTLQKKRGVIQTDYYEQSVIAMC